MKRIAFVALAILGTACANHDTSYDPRVPGHSTASSTDTRMTNDAKGSENAMPDSTPAPAPMDPAATDRNATATAGSVDRTPPMRLTPPATTPPATPPATTPAPAPGARPDVRPDADNTGINKRDRGNANVTPMDQGNSKGDINITAAIRRAVMRDGALSFTAKNVKIITNGGRVVLRGPVKSDQEKALIEAKARAVGGVTDVDNQLEIKQ